MGHGDLIVSLRVGPLIHVGWLFALQDELISHHISYLSSPVDVLEAILLLNGWLRLLYQVLGLMNYGLVPAAGRTLVASRSLLPVEEPVSLADNY
jgi:hypothetical protein